VFPSALLKLTSCEADAILDSNLGIPLLGAAIGNGWIDPRRQYTTYIDFVVKVGLLEENSDVRAACFDLVPNLTLTLNRIGRKQKSSQMNA
jgi:hypothetical protein